MAKGNATPTRHKGVRYRSKFEANVAADLHDRGVVFRYETTRLPYEMAHVYVPDILLPNGILVECKGLFTAIDRKKMLEVKRAHPELDIRLLFMRASTKLARKAPRSQTYGEWATRNGFLWAEGKIPSDWLDQ